MTLLSFHINGMMKNTIILMYVVITQFNKFSPTRTHDEIDDSLWWVVDDRCFVEEN